MFVAPNGKTPSLPQAGLALITTYYKQAFDPASPLPKSKWEVDYGFSRKRGMVVARERH